MDAPETSGKSCGTVKVLDAGSGVAWDGAAKRAMGAPCPVEKKPQKRFVRCRRAKDGP